MLSLFFSFVLDEGLLVLLNRRVKVFLQVSCYFETHCTYHKVARVNLSVMVFILWHPVY